MAKLATDGADGGRRSDESSELLAKFASKLPSKAAHLVRRAAAAQMVIDSSPAALLRLTACLPKQVQANRSGLNVEIGARMLSASFTVDLTCQSIRWCLQHFLLSL